MGNTVGPQTSSASLERVFCMPMWCCLWIQLLDMSSWKSKPLSPLPPNCTCTTAPPQSQRAAASDMTSQTTSAQQRWQGRRSVFGLWPRTASRRRVFLNALLTWSPSGREIQTSPTSKEKDKIPEVEWVFRPTLCSATALQKYLITSKNPELKCYFSKHM